MTAQDPKPRRWPKILAAIAVTLLVLGVVAMLLLDRMLTSAARQQAARLSSSWQRPVEVGSVKATFLTGLGIRVEGVKIGAAAGEPRPLLELDRAEVKLELLRALRTGGQELQVGSAELQGLRITLVKLKDGSTNLSRLSAAMAKPAGAEPSTAAPPSTPAPPVDLSRLRVDHAALLDGRIVLVDETSGGAELSIDRLDLVVNGLAAGAPLELVLKAGLLSKAQNLVLTVHAPPLPPTLIPSPDRVVLKVEPVDLTPLAPFAPRQAGFQGGRFTADLDLSLGAAVPGGAGPTTLRGGFKATGLRFAGQQGGKALDVTLDADLLADAARGDVDIKRLLLAFGPASLEGSGRVTALLSDHPRVDGLRLAARDLDLEALIPYYPPLPALLGGTVAGPVGLSVQAAGTAEQPVIELRADLTPVRLAFTRQLAKAAGGPCSLLVRLRGAGGGALRFEAEGDLSGLDLRPGGTLDKRPGDRLKLAISGQRTAAGAASQVEVAAFTLALVDLELKARGKVELAPGRTRFELAAEADRVDADRLLLQSSAAAPPPPVAVPPRSGASPYTGLTGTVTLRIGEASSRKQKVTAVRASVALEEDQVTLQEARFGIWSGTVNLAGTQARLAPPERPFILKGRAEQVQLGALLAAFTDKKIADARLDAELQLAGKGAGTDTILKALDGTIEGKLLDGAFHGKDLVAAVLEPLLKAVPALRGNVARGGSTSLGKVLPFSLRIQGGRALLQRPLEISERSSTLEVQGSFGFDGELDLPTRLSLTPAAVAEATGGKVRLDGPLPFVFKLEGKAWSPRLTGLDVTPAAKVVAGAVGSQALGKLLGVPGSPSGAETEAAARKRAKEEAEAARKKLEEDGKRALKKLFGG